MFAEKKWKGAVCGVALVLAGGAGEAIAKEGALITHDFCRDTSLTVDVMVLREQGVKNVFFLNNDDAIPISRTDGDKGAAELGELKVINIITHGACNRAGGMSGDRFADNVAGAYYRGVPKDAPQGVHFYGCKGAATSFIQRSTLWYLQDRLNSNAVKNSKVITLRGYRRNAYTVAAESGENLPPPTIRRFVVSDARDSYDVDPEAAERARKNVDIFYGQLYGVHGISPNRTLREVCEDLTGNLKDGTITRDEFASDFNGFLDAIQDVFVDDTSLPKHRFLDSYGGTFAAVNPVDCGEMHGIEKECPR